MQHQDRAPCRVGDEELRARSAKGQVVGSAADLGGDAFLAGLAIEAR